MRWDAIHFCLENPGLQAYLFRRTLGELEDNHIRWIKNDLSYPELGSYNETRKVFEFTNGSRLNFCYCEKDADVHRYQGSEMHWLGIDEATHLTEYQISYLRTRLRLGSFVPDSRYGEFFPRMVLASNPGGPSHNFLKSIFLDRSPPEMIFFDETMKNMADPLDKVWPSIFIPAKIVDNKYIDKNYAGQFSGLPPELARALREGDWDAVVGQALHILSRDRHQLRAFTPPRHWTRIMSIDWGTASPFSIGWYAVSDGATLKGREGWPDRWLPAGAVVRYEEWYGWNGKANQGCRLTAQQVARGIVRKEVDRKEVLDYRVGDSEMWANKGGPAIQDWFLETDSRLVLRPAQKDRKRNYTEILCRLAGNPRYLEDGSMEEDPMFFVTSNCVHFWRTVPSLVLDSNDPEKGPDTTLEDHCYDEVAYLLRSRPYVTTKKDRYMDEFGDEMRKAMGKVEDMYAT